MKRALLILVISLVSSMLITTYTSCSKTASINKSIVQIFENTGNGNESSLVAFGLVVGDGSQVLTVLNYESFTPDGLLVGLPGKTKYHAYVQAIDPRTSATLLKVEGATLKAAVTGAAEPMARGSEIIIHGWPGPGYDKLETRRALFPGYDIVFFVDTGQGPYVTFPGAIVTDKKDRFIGLIGTFYNAFVIRLGGPGMTAPIVDIQSALELLSPNNAYRSWDKNPVYLLITTKETLTGQAPSHLPFTKYVEIKTAINNLLNTVGKPLSPEEFPDNYRSISWGGLDTVDGTLLSVIYPSPVELRNAEDQLVAEAKWVGIQWGRSDNKPNRVFYGYFESGNAIIAGGFILQGDVTELEKTLN